MILKNFTLKHNHLARLIAYDTKLTQKKANEVTTAILGIIGYQIIQNKKLIIRGFGTFYIRKTRPHKHYNPHTKQRFMSKPKNKITFKPYTKLRKEIANTNFLSNEK